MGSHLEESSKKSDDAPPVSSARDAILVPSEAVPAGTRVVSGIDWDSHNGKLTIDDLVSAMSTTGFQATAVADAVRIIREMVFAASMMIDGI